MRPAVRLYLPFMNGVFVLVIEKLKGKAEEFDEAKVVSGGEQRAGSRETSRIHVRHVRLSRENSYERRKEDHTMLQNRKKQHIINSH